MIRRVFYWIFLLFFVLILLVGGYFLFNNRKELIFKYLPGIYWRIYKGEVVSEGKFKGVKLLGGADIDFVGTRFYLDEEVKRFTFKGVVREIDKKSRSVLLEVTKDESNEETITLIIPKDTMFAKWDQACKCPKDLKADKFNLIKEKTIISGGGEQREDSLIAKVVVLSF